MTIDVVDLLRAPYMDGGRTLAEGLDCWGAVKEVRRRLGYKTPDPFRIKNLKDAPELSERVLAAFADAWDIVVGDMEPGDVVVFHGFAGARTHAAVVVGKGQCLHAGRRFGVRIENWRDLRRHAKGVWRSQEPL